jgi:hypothetical protein
MSHALRSKRNLPLSLMISNSMENISNIPSFESFRLEIEKSDRNTQW